MAQELIEGEAAEKAKREKRSEKKKAKKKKKTGAAAEPAAPAAALPPSDDEDADEDGDAQEPSAPAPSDSVGAPPLAGRCGSLGPDSTAPAGGTRAACMREPGRNTVEQRSAVRSPACLLARVSLHMAVQTSQVGPQRRQHRTLAKHVQQAC